MNIAHSVLLSMFMKGYEQRCISHAQNGIQVSIQKGPEKIY